MTFVLLRISDRYLASEHLIDAEGYEKPAVWCGREEAMVVSGPDAVAMRNILQHRGDHAVLVEVEPVVSAKGRHPRYIIRCDSVVARGTGRAMTFKTYDAATMFAARLDEPVRVASVLH